MEYENLRLWGYASAVDNGTHILLYYMVMSTLGQDPDKVAMYTALAISADHGASFVKPELGLVDVGDGGKNNIVWPLAPKTVSKSGDHQTGTVWIDRDLFSGKPDFAKLMREPYPELTEAERAFLDRDVFVGQLAATEAQLRSSSSSKRA